MTQHERASKQEQLTSFADAPAPTVDWQAATSASRWLDPVGAQTRPCSGTGQRLSNDFRFWSMNTLSGPWTPSPAKCP